MERVRKRAVANQAKFGKIQQFHQREDAKNRGGIYKIQGTPSSLQKERGATNKSKKATGNIQDG